MNRRSFYVFVSSLAFIVSTVAVTPAQAGPKLTVRSAANEKGEKLKSIDQVTLKAHRDQQAGKTGGQIPPMIYSGGCLGCDDDMVLIAPSDTGGGESSIDINGGLILPGFREGWAFGTVKIEGTDMPPDDLVAELSLLSMAEYDINFATSILVNLEFSGVSYTSSPFFLRFENIDDPVPALVSLLPIVPSDGLTAVELLVPGPGSYRFSVEYGIADYVVTAGNSSVGIESYSIRWTVVPEPATSFLGTLAMIALAACRRGARA